MSEERSTLWHFAECAVTGRRHRAADLPCQDKTHACESHGTAVIALADGAGSAAFSQEGAETVCREIAMVFSSSFDAFDAEIDGTLVKQQILARLRTALAARADECASSVDALASTLLAVAVKGDRFILLHIGDGVIGCLHDNRLVVLSQPVNGEFINTTVFVTSPEATDTMKLVKGDVSDIYGFVLLSDGTEMSLYDRQQKTLAPVLHRVFNAVCEEGRANVEEMLRGSFENSVIQATGDDCSIALMVRNIKS